MVGFGQIVLNQEIINAELFSFFALLFVCVNSCQNTSILVEVTCLNFYHFSCQHGCYDFFNLLTKLFDIPFSGFWSINSIEPEGKSSEGIVEEDDALDSITVNDFNNFSKENFVIKRKLWRIFDRLEFLILFESEAVVFGENDSFGEEIVDGLLDDLLFIHFVNDGLVFLNGLFLVLTVCGRAFIIGKCTFILSFVVGVRILFAFHE